MTEAPTTIQHAGDAPAAPRILLLAESPYLGGITSHILSIVDAFQSGDTFHFTIATLPGRRSDETLLEQAAQRGLEVHELPMSWRGDLRVLRALNRFVEDHRIDLIHTHNYRASLVARLARVPVPVVNTFHGMKIAPVLSMRFWQWADLRTMRRHRLTIACSDFARQWLIDRGLDPARTRTVYNCCEEPPATRTSGGGEELSSARTSGGGEELSSARTSGPGEGSASAAASRAAYHLPEQALIAAYIGRLVPGKGLPTLIEALAGSAALGLIVGDGPLRPRLEAQARATGADIRFLGRTPDPAPFLEMADIIALPSEMEALPMALIEAAAYGKPSIATRAGGIPEVVQDGDSGILIEPGDSPALAGALARLQSADLRAHMGARARAIWEERFRPAVMAAALAWAYRDALGGAHAG